MIYVGDFETIRRGESMAVWLFDLCELETLTHFTVTDIPSGLELLHDGDTVYFHNIKFDGSYILDYLFRAGYKWKDSSQQMQKKNGKRLMNFLITDMGIWFFGSIINERGEKIKFIDSYKKIPLSVREIAEAYKLPMSKGEIDYTFPRPEGYQPTPEEISYVQRDTEIVARALKIHFDEGLTELTSPSDAFRQLQRTVVDNYRKLGIMFMRNNPAVEAFCRKAYFGGISWVAPWIQEKEVGAGVVYDVNSLYPYVMSKYPYPVYYPTKMYGFSETEGYLWVAEFEVDVRKKLFALPTLRDGVTNQWVESSYKGRVVITSVDYEMLMENYTGSVEFITGYRWAHSDDLLFTDFVKYWGDRKQHDKGGKRQIDKLMLNSSYGKFGLNPTKRRKRAYYHSFKRIVMYSDYGEPGPNGEQGPPLVETKGANNVAIAAFITSYARRELNRGINQSEGFCYCDTDSVHLATYKDPITHETVTPSFSGDVDPVRLGAWKKESTFIRAKYLRQKTYIEEQEPGVFEVKACGMPDTCKQLVNWENFRIGATFPGKLMPKVRPGGIELVESDFTIHSPTIRY